MCMKFADVDLLISIDTYFFDFSKTTAVDTLEGAALKVATFNVQIFGAKKMANQMVRAVLIKVGSIMGIKFKNGMDSRSCSVISG